MIRGGWRDKVSFVLVEPREGGNIGASARALKNMGFRRLALVDPGGYPSVEADRMAVSATDVLDGAELYPGFEEAIREKALVVGTTRRRGKRRGLIAGPEEGARRIIEAAAGGSEVAVVFGREARGLYNSEVEKASFLLSIPTDAEQPSLNLGQAVLLVSYELGRVAMSDWAGEAEISERSVVSMGELDNLFERVDRLLSRLEYGEKGDIHLKRFLSRDLRFMAARAGLAPWEARMLHGIITQIEKRLKGAESEGGEES